MDEVIMPKLGLTMEEGTIVRWLKEEGDTVEEGEILFEVQTDKVVMEVECTASGVLARILVHEDETVPIAQVVAYIAAPGEEVPEAIPGVHPAEEVRVEEVTAAPPVAAAAIAATPAARRLARDKGIDLGQVKGSGKDGMIVKQDVQTAVEHAQAMPGAAEPAPGSPKASPAARRVAREHGIALGVVPGSGPDGRIVEQDVLDFVAQPKESRVEEEGLLSLHPIHKLMAERMSQSFSVAPHFYLGVEVKATALVELRDRLLPICEKEAQVRLTFTDLLVKLLAAALRNHPLANATWEDGGIRVFREINIGLATAIDEGLVVPVVKAADELTLAEIAAARSELAEKAKAGRLTLDEVTGGTFTLTNLGMLGVDVFQAIINPPQSAILATGRILERPVVEDGEVVARPTIYLTLSVDHRVLDGATAARFLQELQTLIEDPYEFFLRDAV
ncbi:MAG: 2-oxo acid dehydrogenase subunit E2 [Anaerolineae bacterium]|nr:2-oxo acid dehydrogenase subunit E2 [Anaerolineae bacterium]NIN95940.1 2-oxo acid dehydrogenase subunit E2 [Anaerolineae bacterium]NIQ78904.1 2-oxo acid dehydrogenase subunit E2 [Anaerolineae bacterium]